jgi:hypothetical protein
MEQKPKRTRKEGQRSKASLAALKKSWEENPDTEGRRRRAINRYVGYQPTVRPVETAEPVTTDGKPGEMASFYSAFPKVEGSNVRRVETDGETAVRELAMAFEHLWLAAKAARLACISLWPVAVRT